MRLIDADALLEQMQPDSKFEINSYADAVAMAIANAYIKLVENQPTVQPELDIRTDGTLHICVKKGQLDKIGRVLVEEDGSTFCKLFY